MNKSLTINSIYNVIFKIVAVLYPLVAVTYVSHILHAQGVGMVSYAQNIVSYFVVLSAMGIPTYGTREIARVADDKARRSQCFWELFFLNALATSFAIILYIALIFSVDKFYLNLNLYLVAGLQLFLNFFNVDWFFQGMEEYKYISIRSIVVKVCSIFLLFILVKEPEDYIAYALVYCIAIAGNNFFNIVKLVSYIEKPVSKLSLKNHLAPILIMLAATLSVELYTMIDTTMLGIFSTDELVGCYSNAMKLTRMVTTTAAAIGAVLLPRLSTKYNDNDLESFNYYVDKGLKVILIIAIPASVGILINSESIIYVFFGSTFKNAIPILRILSLIVPVCACNTILGLQVLVTSNREKKYVWAVTISAIVNIILNLFLIPRFFGVGAAAASLLSEIIVLVLYVYYARDILKLSMNINFFLSIIVPLGIYCILAIIVANIGFGYVTSLCVNILICLFVYFCGSIIMKNEAVLFCVAKIKNRRR